MMPTLTAEAPRILMPEWAEPLFAPRRHKVLWGGRGSGKSYAVADALLLIGAQEKCRILCAREYQISIRDSVHHLLAERIEAHELEAFYQVQRDSITGLNGTEFIFKGVRFNVQSLKSMSGITHLWIEEGQTVSAESWRVLEPTIREPGSEIWITFNPDQDTDPIYQQFVENPPEDAFVQRVNWYDNPFFPDELRRLMERTRRTDPDAYAHIWEGETWARSDAQVLNGKWTIEPFEPQEDWDGPYHGADFGFSSDPTTLVRCYIHNRRLYVSHEAYKIGLELDHTRDAWSRAVGGFDQYVVRADSARPESISYLRRHGVPRIEPAPKWSGSVEDGIAHLRSYEQIVIHPRCKHAADEARHWSYKVDARTGDVLPKIADGNEHIWDAVRYALAPLIQQRGAPNLRILGA